MSLNFKSNTNNHCFPDLEPVMSKTETSTQLQPTAIDQAGDQKCDTKNPEDTEIHAKPGQIVQILQAKGNFEAETKCKNLNILQAGCHGASQSNSK